MTNTLLRLVTATCIGATFASVMNTSPVFAVQFNFSANFPVEGDSPGGSLTGTFSAEDVDGDNILNIFGPPDDDGDFITDFFLEFKSNDPAIFPSFTQSGAELLTSLTLDIKNPPGDNFDFGSQPVEIETPTFGTLAISLGSFEGTFINVSCVDDCELQGIQGETLNFQAVSETVPEHSSVIGIMGFGLLGLGGLRKKKIKMLSAFKIS